MTTATQRQQPFFGDSFFSQRLFAKFLSLLAVFALCLFSVLFGPFVVFVLLFNKEKLLSNTAVRVSCFRTLRKWSQLVICCFVFILMDNSIQRIFWFRVLFCAYVIDPLLTPNTGGRVFVCVVFSLVDPCWWEMHIFLGLIRCGCRIIVML